MALTKENSKENHNDDLNYTKIRKDIEVVSNFIDIYCRENHRDRDKGPVKAPGKLKKYLSDEKLMLCSDCRSLLLHSASKRILCPFDPKPSCKKCPEHCYAGNYR